MILRRAAVQDTVVYKRNLAAAMIYSVEYSRINTTEYTQSFDFFRFLILIVAFSSIFLILILSFPFPHPNVLHYYLFRKCALQLCEYSTRPDRSHQICHAMST